MDLMHGNSMREGGCPLARTKRRGYIYEYPVDLRFTCERCGLCCGDTEFRTRRVLLLGREAEHISGELSLEVEEFSDRVEGQEPYIYVMKKKGGKCVFLRGNLCSIYDMRPIICRSYPFDLEDLGGCRYRFSPTDECPGVGKGPKLSRSFYEDLFEQFLRSMAENRG